MVIRTDWLPSLIRLGGRTKENEGKLIGYLDEICSAQLGFDRASMHGNRQANEMRNPSARDNSNSRENLFILRETMQGRKSINQSIYLR